jgi:small-conductance mechanosensitive channel
VASQVLQVLLVVLGALALHHALERLARRAPFWLARGRAPGPRHPLRRGFALAGMVGQIAVWLCAFWLASSAHAALAELRRSVALALMRGLSLPLLGAGERSYSLRDLALPPLLLAAIWLLSSGAVRMLRARVLAPAGLDAGLQETLSLLVRYALVIPAALVLLQVWGVDLRALAILASVLGLGIGFGLQNIANNFVSGVLLNLERPIRPGDYVEVGGSAGTVERIGARSTLIRTVDQVAVLVPNARLLESEVINWSHGDPLSRLHVPIGVAYGSDPAHVRRVLLQAAQDHPSVVREPRARVELRGFGASALDFELLVWTRDPRSQRAVVSELNYRIHDALRGAGIEIPFSQQDVSLRAPALESWLEQWSGRPVGEPARAPAAAVARTEPEAPARLSERPPDEWTAKELEALVGRMRGPGGLAICDRRHRLRTYARSFVGREAVRWLMEHEGLAREDALALGRRLVAQGIIHHVLDEHDFRDAALYYRFRSDEPLDAGLARVG